jgi:hypothetical protein
MTQGTTVSTYTPYDLSSLASERVIPDRPSLHRAPDDRAPCGQNWDSVR